MGKLAKIKQDKLIARRLKEFPKTIPSDHLRKLAEVRGMLSEWVQHHQFAEWISINLAARFGSGDGSPALEAQVAGVISIFGYEIVEALVDWQNDLFTCIQKSWTYQRKELEGLEGIVDEIPRNEIDLFLLVLRDLYDMRMEHSFRDHETTVKQASLNARIARDTLRADSSGTLVESELAESWGRYQLADFRGIEPFWYKQAMGVVDAYAKTNRPLEIQRRRTSGAFAHFLDLMQLRTTAELKGKVPPGEKAFRSVQVKNGVVKLGKKGGYECVT
jgi:hypothetical protein